MRLGELATHAEYFLLQISKQRQVQQLLLAGIEAIAGHRIAGVLVDQTAGGVDQRRCQGFQFRHGKGGGKNVDQIHTNSRVSNRLVTVYTLLYAT